MSLHNISTRCSINVASIISQNTRFGALTIFPAQLTQVKKQIYDENEKAQAKGKKVSKSSKSISVVIPKPKLKRKLVVQKSDSERTPSPQLVNKSRKVKSKPTVISSLPIFVAILSGDTSVVEAPIVAVPISVVVNATTEQAPVSKHVKASTPKSAKKSVAQTKEASLKKAVETQVLGVPSQLW